MKQRPAVSVVMPTFDRLQYIPAAVASVVGQSFTDWELIVVDDGSGDPVRHYLEGLSDPRITVEFLAHTGHPAVARNRAIARARGKYVAFIDSDDRWSPDKLELQLQLMKSAPKRRWSYTAVRGIDAEDEVLNDGRSQRWVPFEGSIIEALLRIDAQIAMPTVISELSLLHEVGGFDENFRFIEDYELWSRLALKSEVSVDPRPLADVRNHPYQFSWNHIGKHSGWTQYYAKMEHLIGDARLRALCRSRGRTSLLTLAAVQARARKWGGMSCTLIRAILTGAWSPRHWLRVAREAASALRHRPSNGC